MNWNRIFKRCLIIFFVFSIFGVILLGCNKENLKSSANLLIESEVKMVIFAGGCFWCTEYVLESLPGVMEVVSGYAGGKVKNPTYEQVSTGNTGHYESVLLKYDNTKLSYERLLEVFWKNIDPTDPSGQFYDKGTQYQTAIFYFDDEQRSRAEESKRRIELANIFESKIVTKILPVKEFYPAEDYHQNYYKTCPVRFKNYHKTSGRDNFTLKAWELHKYFRLFPERKNYWLGYEKPSKKELQSTLTPLQYKVTQENGTEPPFNNEYWNNHREGIYVDIVSGEPLFSSKDKFDSGTGWPSFTQSLESENIVERSDESFAMLRTEVRSRHADSHLGHLFHDGPPPTKLRYCTNSAGLYFIPKEELMNKGYVFYLNRLEEEQQ